MTTAKGSAAGAADLSACDREPIHIPGSIQPFGVLLALEEPGWTVLQASANVAEVLGREPAAVLGRPLEKLLGAVAVGELRDGLVNPSLGEGPLYVGNVTLGGAGGPRSFVAVAHRMGGVLILELEPADSGASATFQGLYPLVRSFLARLAQTPDVEELARLAAAEVRRIVGYDRVLIYRFDEDGHGTVIAEDRNDRLPSYLGHRFPASDIPAQARELYRVNRIRVIADAGYRPVPIEPTLNPRTGAPLDLTCSTLRSISPVHLEYMRNMGTAASMSISILRAGQLWGLISCHSRDPRPVPFEVRTACDMLGQVLSLFLEAKQHQAEYEHRIRLKSMQSRLLAAMANRDDFVGGLADAGAELLELVGAQGVAILHEGRCTLVGRTPEEAAVRRLAGWLAADVGREVFATDALSEHYPESEGFQAAGAGVLAVAISKLHRSFVLWFRPEVVRTIRWGGDPSKPAEPDGRDGRLHPRRSFELWKEVVRRRSLPWREAELDAATELRNAIVGLVLRRAEEMAELTTELRRSNKELEAFSYSVSHDLRAPFRHIAGYAELLLEDEGLGETGRRYARTIIESAEYAGVLVDNLLSFSKMARSTLEMIPIDMDRLVAEVRRDVMGEAAGRRVRWEVGPLPAAVGDPMMVRLAVRNLLSNAIKYTRGRDEAVIEVSGAAEGDRVAYHVRDNGIGFDMKYVDKLFGVFQRLHRMEEFEGTGIGLANVRRIVERHGGRAWAEGVVAGGATFSFTLPRAAPSVGD